MLKHFLFLVFITVFTQPVNGQQKRSIEFSNALSLNKVVDTTIFHSMGKEELYEVRDFFFPFGITHRLESDSMLMAIGQPEMLSVKPAMAGCELEGNRIKGLCLVFLTDAMQVQASLVRNFGNPHQKARFSLSGDDSIDTGSSFWQLENFYIIAISTIVDGKQVYKVAVIAGKKKSG